MQRHEGTQVFQEEIRSVMLGVLVPPVISDFKTGVRISISSILVLVHCIGKSLVVGRFFVFLVTALLALHEFKFKFLKVFKYLGLKKSQTLKSWVWMCKAAC